MHKRKRRRGDTSPVGLHIGATRMKRRNHTYIIVYPSRSATEANAFPTASSRGR